jgi:hypothetical protein
MKKSFLNSKIVLPVIGAFAGAIGSSQAATTVIVEMAPMGAAPAANIAVSTGAVRTMGAAAPANIAIQATPVPDSGSVRRPDAPSDASAGRAPSNRRRAQVQPTPSTGSAKEALSPMEIEYTDPGAFAFSAEAGYSSKHLWRGIDLVEFTSFNHTSGGALNSADSGVSYFGANASYKGFGFGAKYIESIDDELNPFFAPLLTDQDSYQELVLSINYTRMLIGDNILQGTVGFDFYYYPNDEFWGVEHQGMIFARFSSPQHKWAQPFVELFYNVATDSSGSGLAAEGLGPFIAPVTSFRGATGSDLVEGYGAEIGVNGGDVVFTNDRIAVGLTYSLSTFYKSGYAFESDGFSHVSLTVGAPISFGPNFTITPSVTYVHELSDITPQTNAAVPDSNPSAYNEPGFVGAIKASWSF